MIRIGGADLPETREVWKWPEFRAFAKRLGIELKVHTRRLTIDMDCDHQVGVTQTFFAEDKGEQGART